MGKCQPAHTGSVLHIEQENSKMNVIIRQESEEDYEVVFELIEKAFKSEQKSDHKEQFVVERLRKSNAFVPELSIVSETGHKIVGHIY